jgi:putative transposase
MPRPPRIWLPGHPYHAWNRANRRQPIFLKDKDYTAFLNLLVEAKSHADVDILAFCIMPNHWHLVLRQEEEDRISRYMQWLMGRHASRYHADYGLRGTGHLYQDRFKSRVVNDDHDFLGVCRYVESNPLRAGLVGRAEQWPWSSLVREFAPDGSRILTPWPIPRPADWITFVNEIDMRAVDPSRVSRKKSSRKGSDPRSVAVPVPALPAPA